MNLPDLHNLTGAYVADALPEEERRQFEGHLPMCEECQREVAELQETATSLATAVAEAPSPDLKGRVMAEIDTVRQERPVTPLEPRRRRAEWARRLAAPAAAVLVLVVAGLSTVIANLNARIDELETRTTAVVDVLAAPDSRTLTAQPEQGPAAKVVISPERGEAVFVASGLQRLSEDRVYELWLIDDSGPAPAGLFHPDERGQITTVVDGNLRDVNAIAMTIEPEGGSEQPTTEPLVVVET